MTQGFAIVQAQVPFSITADTQRTWTDPFTVAYVSGTQITYTALDTATATNIANSIIGRLLYWKNGDASATKHGFVVNATASSATVTINVAGDVIGTSGAGPTNSNLATFRFSISKTVKFIDWYIPGEQIADATNPAGKQYFNRTSQDWRILSTSAYLGTAGVHSGTGVMTYNIYNGANAIFSAAPDLVETAALDNSIPNQNNPIAGGARITLRTPGVTADTTKPQDLYIAMFYAYDDFWDAV